MARIAIFCDGTWNSPTMKQPTHVVRLFEKTPRTNSQHTHYFEGVGVDEGGVGPVSQALMKIGGGAFGWGLNENIKQAYAALCEQYEPEDEIFIFGFSRGAYTARSLAGMIRKCGIVADPTPKNLSKAFKLYRKPGAENHPDALHILKSRRELSPRFATSQADMDWRTVTPWRTDTGQMHQVDIAYLGIWDTVGSLGIPAPLLGPVAHLWNSKYRFHDTLLSSMVKSARHAVALDERRVFYRPSLWENLEASRDDAGLNAGDRSDERPYQQVWFTGTHAIVGGSAPKARALTGQSLQWIAEGAQKAGLQIDMADLLDRVPNPLADSHTLSQPPWLYTVAGNLLKWRKGPGHPIDLHDSAKARIDARRDYRPRSLKNLMPTLFGDPEPVERPEDRNEPGR
ncbi:DUF2235 domain-containing protein [Sulfitobacter donghicola]|uniref:T6SS Phospholipase effector Tle1-like catalytic domain-containing protein n=1 Tax=Sulfitobacter donghicola DSW-25 = KCTC 12864 = JCM 14565 TaxID=1300350 RepID=A0A073IKL4_9RHOB|nr:DUF2235 domain-containing protein [Sulfitobacter donghicola]KEJ90100.1 hypothetical protein DSW25_07825 [Sulfitobacter donghicola DSW-25 = KCTC 12864 = JCM 14565]KIN66747.1 Peptidoglycan binding domain protein [Sulfitobacter donghicola DSW-25 = KCTC 12864 = JCM 14565]